MQLKAEERKNSFRIRNIVSPSLLTLTFGAVFYTGVTFLGGAYLNRANVIGETVVPRLIQGKAIVRNIVSGFLADPLHLSLDVRHEDLLHLAKKREEALKIGLLLDGGDEDYVPATLRHASQTVKIDLRLKGDLSDHYEDKEKWSFMVKVKAKKTFLGMRRFSLQHPRTRHYLGEWIFHQALKREGVLSLRYHFVQVTLNGKNLGIYALEEHFDKLLIEHGQKREGPILRFDETLTWQNIAHFGDLAHPKELSISVLPVGVHSQGRTFKDPQLKANFLAAAELLEKARQKEIPYSRVFDIELFGKYFALLDLLGAQHSASPANFRFYYNPITNRLEPIGFDGDAGQRIPFLLGEAPALDPRDDLNFVEIWNDRELLASYLRHLERLSQGTYLDDLFLALEPELKRNLRILHKNYPAYLFSKASFYENRNYIRSALNPIKGAHAYFHKISDGKIELKLANIQPFPLEVTGVSHKGILFPPLEPIVLERRRAMERMEFKSALFRMPENFTAEDAPALAGVSGAVPARGSMPWAGGDPKGRPLTPPESIGNEITLHYKVIGTSGEKTNPVYPWSHFSESVFDSPFLEPVTDLAPFGFLEIDESKKEIRVKPGEWTLHQNLVIPTGYRFMAGGGTHFTLTNGANVVSHSPVLFQGLEESPIVIDSPDSTGQGFVVLKAQGLSLFERVTFRNLDCPSQGKRSLTGAVTFYESPVELVKCKFLQNRPEDSLNIVRSEFAISDSFFDQSHADAFDADFTSGEIVNTSFVNSGNDAIDVSGSHVKMEKILIQGAADKGISVGEHSVVEGDDVLVKDAEIGVASKDLSRVILRNVRLEGVKVGLSVYQKKPEYGAGTITAEEIELRKVEVPYMVEEGSFLKVEGERIAANAEHVKAHFYGREFGKASD